jgi:hypothetical protein
MIEGLKGATRQSTPSLAGDSDQTVESLALAGATAIQHLITERDSLRGPGFFWRERVAERKGADCA